MPLFFGGENFVGLIGENGVGKSSVFEALNAFFTDQGWVRNKITKSGKDQCGVAPIVACTDADLAKYFTADEIKALKKNSKDLAKNQEYHTSGTEVYISCMRFQDNATPLFDGRITKTDALGEKVKEFILTSFKYIYVSAEVDIDSGTNINSKTTEFIKGSGVVGEITKLIQGTKVEVKGKQATIASHINDMVIEYLNTDVIKKLQAVDEGYNYKNLRTGVSSNLSEKQISELAAQALFSNRELTKRTSTKDIGISDMSSGQRRRAFLDFIIVMIGNLEPQEREKLILAIDEPEISVDAGSRIQQFDKLRGLTQEGPSIAFTTHWYGWIAQLIHGCAVLMKDSESGRSIVASKIQDFLDKDAQQKAPYEMRMMFDFLSSLGTWAESDSHTKFVLCEGPTDKNYIEIHFDKHKIIPLRGRDEVIRLFKIFSDYYFRADKKPSNIVFLIDTDPEKAAELKDNGEVNLKRISRDKNGEIKIVSKDENYSEKCAIEDLLSPTPLLKALKESADKLPEEKDREFINNLNIKYHDQTGVRAFGIDDVERQKLKEIFKTPMFKLNVSELYQPSGEEMDNFRTLLSL